MLNPNIFVPETDPPLAENSKHQTVCSVLNFYHFCFGFRIYLGFRASNFEFCCSYCRLNISGLKVSVTRNCIVSSAAVGASKETFSTAGDASKSFICSAKVR